jgi:hypothetical protein
MGVGVGEYLVRQAMKRGMVVFVDTDGVVKYYPESRMSQGFLRLLNSKYHYVKHFLIMDAVST